MSLSSDQLTVISRARRSAIRHCFGRLRGFWQYRRWLSEHNRYREDCVGQIRTEYAAADTERKANHAPKSQLNQFWRPNHRQLCDYVAASTLTHCADGWTYLGQAISAELAGAPDIARHLGYYAELRAAMAILAGEGLGIFNNHHVAVVSRARCELIPMGPADVNTTHQFTWEVLREWASGSAGPDLLGTVVLPGRVLLGEWMDQYPLAGRSLATSWLTQWGLDLSRMAYDREARNQASYRPTAFTSPGPTSVTDTLQAVCDFWRMCRPGVFGGFPYLDKHLLRRAIDGTFSTAYEQSGRDGSHAYKVNIDRMLSGITLVEGSRQQWKAFLEFDDDPDTPQLLLDAGATAGPEDPKHSHHVIARAVLLLRVATGSIADLMRNEVSPGMPELDFWWLDSAISSRLWPKRNPPESFSDLWQDIQDASDSVTTWLRDSQDPCRYGMWREQSDAMAALATAERVALWGLKL